VTRDFGWQCLLARRLSERGVRFVQCSHSYWDQHSELKKLHTQYAQEVDQPIAGLLKDLKARGLFKDTLVIWGGEFGRTPWAQNADGRDTILWLHDVDGRRGREARLRLRRDGRVRISRGGDRMHIHDLHATILHLMGLNHEKLTYPYAGRDSASSDVAGTVAQGLIA